MLVTLCAIAPDAIAAENWSARPPRLVIPLGPGSVSDMAARQLADRLQAAPGQPVVVENKVRPCWQIAGAALKHMMKMDSVGVAYKNAPEAVADPMGGREQYALVDMGNAFPHIQPGRLRAIAVSSQARSALTPSVPSVAEQTSLKGTDLTAWGATFGPTRMPAPIVERLHAEIDRIVADASFAERLRQAGVETQQDSPKKLKFFVVRQLAVRGAKVGDAKIQAE